MAPTRLADVALDSPGARPGSPETASTHDALGVDGAEAWMRARERPHDRDYLGDDVLRSA